MPLHFSFAPYRLLFKRPFATAHGLRNGTDALFIRAEEDGVVGHGEVTLPPYVKETIAGSIERLNALARKSFPRPGQLLTQLDTLDEIKNAPAFRAGVSTALIDLISNHRQWTVRKLIEVTGEEEPITLMTLGICPATEVAERLAELPRSGALKLKVGDPEGSSRLEQVIGLDDRRLLLDGNQGFKTMLDAADLARVAGDRLIGFEQPFGTGTDTMNDWLAEEADVAVFADESIQDRADLGAKYAHFSGVNLKLMKCGGLDRAKAMADKARQLGMQVMLGSMSESSLGCSAMAQLASEADIVDLDGPWLIQNDPFKGIDMLDGRLRLPDGPGMGAQLVGDLAFTAAH
ncbi:MAG TPA: enolase C-terminal domain-like protein [Flavobacteriales bacterium]|nr:hypothetical protein [Flavobacteriales bacterium]HMW96999.1 enolase C-terminal domain-like protein [Flavobacteriales bacterium]HNI06086.1 enolase C-terminal domain-like protein [Flavobacteriales bacterium]HNK84714.1 enolase C-terminal domain-like protein [Flavobacteriales bacterium]HNM70717.1 enolase C-terminal domain-like protein [Flavobacteriales bacterium]